MTDNPRVEKLLEELLDSDATPEEVCRDCPELLPEVRAGWQRLRALKAEVGALFPESTSLNGATPDGTYRPETPLNDFPRIAGYEILGILGHGGMGVVYRAWQLSLNRAVALKMLLAGAYARTEELERFLREAEAVASLRHANIVQVYDVGNFEGRPYFTMELVEAGSLAQKLAGTPQPAGQAAKMVATIAEAIQIAHQNGIIHRDLKPANTLLSADGAPKITDFGLARRLENVAGLTLSGAAVGTPSYMAPEQARGDRNAIGPSTDVYALGAILYEMLTGRPPFRAETASATVQQVLADDPVSAARLNPQVPRDLETICLKCLRKEPERRYASAAALADDLRRFERGEPIAARPMGRLERLARWVRRRPAQVVVLAGSFLLIMALVGGGLWRGRERAVIIRDVEEDLREVARLEQGADWTKASAALARAQARLGRWPAAELHERLELAGRDLDLAARLDAIHLKWTAVVEGRVDNRGLAAKDYEAAFLETGLGEVYEAPSAVAERVKASNARIAIVAALDDWALCSPDASKQAWLLAVARRADPEAWRDRVRDPAVWRDRVALTEMAGVAPLADQPVQFLVVLADRLQTAGGDATEFLTRVQQANPTNFHANFALANALIKSKPAEAIGYYRAAVVSRPEAAMAHYKLGAALRRIGQHAEAIVCLRRAISLDPSSAWAYYHLGGSLQDTGQPDEAIDCYRQAVRLDPKLPWAYFGLGTALRSKGRRDEAIDSYRQALQLDPKLPWVHYGLGEALADQDRGDEAIDSYRKALQLGPRMAWAHYRLGICLKLKGELKEAKDHFRQAAEIEPNNVEFLNGVRSISDAPMKK